MDNKIKVLLFIVLGFVIGFVIAHLDFSSLKRQLPLSCTYKGETYKSGESFQDDCNNCSCQGGEVMCTLIACNP